MEHRDRDTGRRIEILKQTKIYGTQRQRYRKRKSDHQTGLKIWNTETEIQGEEGGQGQSGGD